MDLEGLCGVAPQGVVVGSSQTGAESGRTVVNAGLIAKVTFEANECLVLSGTTAASEDTDCKGPDACAPQGAGGRSEGPEVSARFGVETAWARERAEYESEAAQVLAWVEMKLTPRWDGPREGVHMHEGIRRVNDGDHYTL